jgi:hypothetical protein
MFQIKKINCILLIQEKAKENCYISQEINVLPASQDNVDISTKLKKFQLFLKFIKLTNY